MRIAVLMGAGASYGAGVAAPYPPPLGGQLYGRLQETFPQTWGNLVNSDEDAAFLDPTRPFERGMELLSQKRDARLQELLIDMGIYFSRFVPLPKNGYHVLLVILEYAPHLEWHFCSLNYDTLFEQAAWQRGLVVNSLGQFVPAFGRAPLILSKPHGSCNYIVANTENFVKVSFSGTQQYVGITNAQPGQVQVMQPSLVEPLYNAIRPSIPPMMSLYEQRKETPVAAEYVETIRREWTLRALQANVILCIGVRPIPADEHIWRAVFESHATVWFIGGRDDAFRYLQHKVGRRLFHLGETFRTAIPPLVRSLERTAR